MDFMNLLRSAELLLYEVVSWLVFYPLTMWRCLTRPVAMMAYAERELTLPAEEQFDEALSPPIFLFLTLMIAHMIQRGIFRDDVVLDGVLADQRNLLVLRAVAFSLFPLLVAIQHVRRSGQVLSRATLRPMFYAQCYVTVPFVMMLDVAIMLSQAPARWTGPSAWALFVLALCWYSVALTRGFMIHRKASSRQAVSQTVLAILVGGICFLATVALAVLGSPTVAGL